MPKIRTIKPDFWDSPAVARASLRARLLYIAMWNWADDWGVGDAHPGRLISFAFPNDDLDPARIPQIFQEVSNLFEVYFFEHEGRPYYYITTWEKHQRIDKRAKQWIPIPDMADGALFPQVNTTPPESPQNPTESPGTSGAGNRKREVGNRKTIKDSRAEKFKEFWEVFPNERKAARKQCVDKFNAAIDDGVDPDIIIAAAIRYRDDPNRTAEYTAAPLTWLNQQRWEAGPLPPREVKPGQQVPVSDRDQRIKSWRSRNGQPPVPADLLNTDPAAANAWGRAFLAAIGDGKTDQQAIDTANQQTGR